MAAIAKAERFFTDRFGLDSRELQSLLGSAVGKRADYGDIYFEYRVNESIALEDGVVTRTSKNISQGVGLRVVAEDRTGYAHCDEVTVDNLKVAAAAAGHIAREGSRSGTVPVPRAERGAHDLYHLPSIATEFPLAKRVELLDKIDRRARAGNPRIKNVIASILIEHKVIMILRSEGSVVGDLQPLVRINVTCIAEQGNNRQQGAYGGGGRRAFEYFLDQDRYLTYVDQAVRQAMVNLEAGSAPAGEMPVVLGPGWPGILLHEAIGHGLEGDFNRKGVSAFSSLLGQQVASPLCTVVDDGTIPNRRGSLNVDDEGTPTSRTVLIENGILRSYMHDRMNATLMKMPMTGNGRRESFAHMPMPRMTNTFMLPGDSSPQEIIGSVQRGLYAVSFGGGQVDITNGKFVFSASEAYLIEDGKATKPVKGATLIGNGPDVLRKVSMVGNDLELDAGIGTCGKDGQSVPVGVGLPTVKVEGMTVGGTRV